MRPLLLLCALALVGAGPVKTLRIVHAETPANELTLRELLAGWEAKHPEVKLEYAHAQVHELPKLVAEQKADLVLSPVDHVAALGALPTTADLSGMVPASGVDAATLSLGKIGARLVGMPLYRGSQLMLFYDKRLVTKAPGSWAEMLAMGEALKTSKKVERALLFPTADAYWAAPMVAGAVWPFAPSGEGWGIQLDQAAVSKGLALHARLAAAVDAQKVCDYYCAINGFKLGQAPFLISGDWNVADMRQALGESLGIAPLPAPTQIHGGFLVATALGGNAELAKDLVRELTTVDAQVKIALTMKRLPALDAARNAPALKADAVLAQVAAVSQNAKPVPAGPMMDEFWKRLAAAMDAVRTGRATPEAAAAALAAQYPKEAGRGH